MFCEQCKKDHPDKDFLPKQTSCYRCVYKSKIKRCRKIDEYKFCRICNSEIFVEKDCKFRQRNVFCSIECAEIGHKDQTMNHWTKKLRSIDLPY